MSDSEQSDSRTAPQIVADATDPLEALTRYVGNVLETDGFGVDRRILDLPEADPAADYALIVSDASGQKFYLEVDSTR